MQNLGHAPHYGTQSVIARLTVLRYETMADGTRMPMTHPFAVQTYTNGVQTAERGFWTYEQAEAHIVWLNKMAAIRLASCQAA